VRQSTTTRSPYSRQVRGDGGSRRRRRRDLVEDLGDRRLAPAEGAVGPRRHRQHVPRSRERVVQDDPPDRNVPDPGDELERLGRLQRAHDSRHDAEHARLRARCHRARRRGLGEHAAVARAASGPPDAELAGEGVHRRPHVRDPCERAGIADEIAGREVVRPVQDDVVCADQLTRRRGREAAAVEVHRDVRVEVGQPVRRGLHLGTPQVGLSVQWLAVQVGYLDMVVVDDPDRPDACGGEVGQRRRPKSPGPDDEDTGGPEPPLPDLADLRQASVSRIAFPLRSAEVGSRLDERSDLHTCTIVGTARPRVVVRRAAMTPCRRPGPPTAREESAE
jgi:hypothetical protein